MSEESDRESVVEMPILMEHNNKSPLESSQAQEELLDAQTIIELNRSTAEANQSAIELNRSNLEIANTPQGQAMRKIQDNFQAKQLEMLRNFQEEQLKNLQTTFDILFRQSKGAALMFYVSFWLGVVLIVASVCSYLFLRDPNNLLTIAFFGVGALAMLSFFIRDPAEKVQQTAGKLVQIQDAMRCHLTEVGYWEIYIAQKRELGLAFEIEELERASKSIRLGTQTIMRQIDESLDDIKRDHGNREEIKKLDVINE